MAALRQPGKSLVVHVPRAEGRQAPALRRHSAQRRRLSAVSRRLSAPGCKAAAGKSRMGVPHGIYQPLLCILALIAFEKLLIVVDVARNDVEVETLRRFRLAIHEQRETFRAGIAQPLL